MSIDTFMEEARLYAGLSDQMQFQIMQQLVADLGYPIPETRERAMEFLLDAIKQRENN